MSTFEVGIHYGIPEEEYHSIVAASSSRLSLLKRSPAHMKQGRAPSKSFADGTLIHKAVLEPALWSREHYVRAPVGDKRKKEVKQAWADAIDEYGEERLLPADTYDMCHAIAMNVSLHPVAAAMLVDIDAEATIMWLDPDTGVECKGRIDALPRSGRWKTSIIDVKSTQDASRNGFEQSFFRFGYYRQMAFYLSGLEKLGLWCPEAHITAVEKAAPYASSIFRCDEGALDAGQQENRVLLRKYRECDEHDHWPAYPEDPQDITIPSWAYAKVDDYLQENE